MRQIETGLNSPRDDFPRSIGATLSGETGWRSPVDRCYRRRVRDARQREEYETLVEWCRRLQARMPQAQREADRAGERARLLRGESRAACERAGHAVEDAYRRGS
jgi:hypothetical protein